MRFCFWQMINVESLSADFMNVLTRDLNYNHRHKHLLLLLCSTRLLLAWAPSEASTPPPLHFCLTLTWLFSRGLLCSLFPSLSWASLLVPLCFSVSICPLALSYLQPQSFGQEPLNTPTVVCSQLNSFAPFQGLFCLGLLSCTEEHFNLKACFFPKVSF